MLPQYWYLPHVPQQILGLLAAQESARPEVPESEPDREDLTGAYFEELASVTDEVGGAVFDLPDAVSAVELLGVSPIINPDIGLRVLCYVGSISGKIPSLFGVLQANEIPSLDVLITRVFLLVIGMK